jgi:hypothetical protein
VSSTHAQQLLQNINKVFRISRRKFDTFYTEIELETTKNSGGNMYESFGWIGIQPPEKYKENFDVSSESPSICTVSVLYTSYLTFADKYNLLKNKYYIFLCFKIYI